MEALRLGDPCALGPYELLSRLDDPMGLVPGSYRRFLGRKKADGATAVVTSPLDATTGDLAYSARFRAEASGALQIAARESFGLAPVTEVSGPTEQRVWYASRCTPGIALPSALVAHNGPLPERTVRLMGAALAECLGQVHAAGHAHAGVTPLAVLLTPSGPRLTDFGAVRAAGPDGEGRTEAVGLLQESTAPEQLAGGRPRPLGDVYGLGCVLAFASTGRLAPDDTEIPDWLRPMTTACLAADAAARPQPADLVVALMRDVGDGPGSTLPAGVHGAGGPGAVGRSLAGGWLPPLVIAALAEQTEFVLSADPKPHPAGASEAHALSPAEWHVVPTEVSSPDGAERPESSEDVSSTGTHATGSEAKQSLIASLTSARPSRRLLLTGLAAGTTGTAIGFGTVALTGFGEEGKNSGRRRMEGVAPRPLWRRRLKDDAPTKVAPLVWRDRVVVIGEGIRTAGFDTRSGERRWTNDEVLLDTAPMDVGAGALLLPEEPPTFVSASRGTVRWREGEYDGLKVKLTRPLGRKGRLLFCLLSVRDPDGGEGRPFLAAYDVGRRRETWRTELPEEFVGEDPSSLSPRQVAGDDLIFLEHTVVVAEPAGRDDGGAAKPRKRFVAFDADDGAKRWSKTYEGASLPARVYPLPARADTAVLVAEEGVLRVVDLSSGETAWTARLGGIEHAPFSTPVLHGGRVYVADGQSVVTALDARTGETVWRRDPRLAVGTSPDETLEAAVSASGRTLLVAAGTEILAFSTEDGRLLWRLADESGALSGLDSAPPPRHIAVAGDTLLVAHGRTLLALPVS